ncbi:ferritin-like domain-containing protein [Ignisphaera sp. 4213-co]|uniref:Ferritin-like domain-containing protein n=1 Tax=Ignisphaera cupida TaxID=3050454 RepID=A0ABD4Z501_9CREN|nr:ferritin-like domain-containing protein [Ignisphaera sp. 4213-co]MDK6028077.1 ferritin-like domain-containing protein [Ignisphaera sp. 4213-co]
MLSEHRKYLELFVKMIDIEKSYAEALSELGNKINHPVLRSIFIAVANDSIKHSQLYKSITELLTSPQPVISDSELEIISKEIEKHIETEAQMIKIVGEALQHTNDPRLKLILAAIYEDEVKHHKILIDIRENIAKKEVISEEDIWELIWRDSPWHGTPGG